MKLVSLSFLLLLLLPFTSYAQQTPDESALIEAAKKRSAEKRKSREAFFAKHPKLYQPEKEDEAMKDYEARAIKGARQEYLSALKKERLRPREVDKQDIRISYGLPPTITLIGSILSPSRHSRFSSPDPLGTVSVGYKYFIEDNFAIGVSAGIEFLKGTIGPYYYSSSYGAVGKYTQRVITIAPEGTFVFAAIKKKLFYSSLAIGYSSVQKTYVYDQDSYNATYYNGVTTETNGESSGHINGHAAAGIRLGGTIGGFIELGLGFRGLFNCGLSCKL